jgi:hypothetical protein
MQHTPPHPSPTTSTYTIPNPSLIQPQYAFLRYPTPVAHACSYLHYQSFNDAWVKKAVEEVLGYLGEVTEELRRVKRDLAKEVEALEQGEEENEVLEEVVRVQGAELGFLYRDYGVGGDA